jgi:hypothetical protein
LSPPRPRFCCHHYGRSIARSGATSGNKPLTIFSRR